MKRKGIGVKGFTLVELAIVLVIIGIIIGAVLKGQDLIANARSKQFVNKSKAWEVATWTYFDRKGKFAGDTDKDGKIGDGNVKTDLTGANFINPPYEGTSGSETNTITLGSQTFYVFLGTDGGADAGKNIMMLCAASDCNTAFSTDNVVNVEAYDAALDGVSDGTAGQVVCDAAPPAATAPSTASWIAAYASGAITPAACNTSAKVLIYYFDAKR